MKTETKVKFLKIADNALGVAIAENDKLSVQTLIVAARDIINQVRLDLEEDAFAKEDVPQTPPSQ